MRIVHPANFALSVKHTEANRLPSETVPDMTISLREQFERWKSGGRVKSNSDELPAVPYGLDDIDVNNIHRMDKVERVLAGRRVADFISTSRGRLITAREQRQRDAIIEQYKRSLPPPPINEGPST